MAPHYAYYVREMKIKAYAQVIISTSFYFLLPFDVFFLCSLKYLKFSRFLETKKLKNNS